MSLNLSRICMLFQLRCLKISSDIMVELPAQMQGLRYLEILDIDASVSAVPLDIVYLPSLLHLGLRDAIKLPDGIGRIKSLSTLLYFDLICNSKDNIRSLGKLTNLQHLHLTCSSDMSSDHLKRKLKPLVSSLGKLGNLKSFTLTPVALRTVIFFDISSGVSSPSNFLQRLELLPPICLFSRLPPCIGELHKLRILKIMVKELRGNDINNIAGLPSLIVFSLYVHTALTGPVIFSNMAFPALKYFKFTCGVMCLAFQAGAMPNLQRLKLCFNAHKGESNSRLLGGIEHLLNLREVSGRIGECPVGDGSKSRAVKLSFEETIRMHPRCPRFRLQLVDSIEEEYPPLDKLHRRQQEGSSVEHGIIIEEDCAEDPNKHVDSRFFGQFGIPSASGTSCHLKSADDSKHHMLVSTLRDESAEPSTHALSLLEDTRKNFSSEQEIDQGGIRIETSEGSAISSQSDEESKASLTPLLIKPGKELIHHKEVKTKITIRIDKISKKCLSKAFKVALSVSGVDSVNMASDGDDKCLLVVTGDVDPVDLVRKLRKKVGMVEIVSILACSVKEKSKGIRGDLIPSFNPVKNRANRTEEGLSEHDRFKAKELPGSKQVTEKADHAWAPPAAMWPHYPQYYFHSDVPSEDSDPNSCAIS